MTKKDIDRLAKEAGLQPYYDQQALAIEKFAELVAAYVTAKSLRIDTFDSIHPPPKHTVG